MAEQNYSNLEDGQAKPVASVQSQSPGQEVKIVAEMPGDQEMRDQTKDMKEHDGYEGSCGI